MGAKKGARRGPYVGLKRVPKEVLEGPLFLAEALLFLVWVQPLIGLKYWRLLGSYSPVNCK